MKEAQVFLEEQDTFSKIKETIAIIEKQEDMEMLQPEMNKQQYNDMQ